VLAETRIFFMLNLAVLDFKELSDAYVPTLGHAVARLVEALRYKPEGRGFDS
jgi:hypothetical protein